MRVKFLLVDEMVELGTATGFITREYQELVS